MAAEHDVHEASKKFYAALNHMATGDSSLMGDIWSHGRTVTTMQAAVKSVGPQFENHLRKWRS